MNQEAKDAAAVSDLAKDLWLTNWFRHPLVRRMFWFGVGGVLSIGGNLALLRLGMDHFGLTKEVAYAASLAVMTGFTFAWSYFVNFRTSEAWHRCAGKYVATLAVCYGINYLLVHTGFRIIPDASHLVTALIVAAAQILVAFLKFGIFHFWVFPSQVREA